MIWVGAVIVIVKGEKLIQTSGAELCQAQINFIMFDLVEGILIIDQLNKTNYLL